MLIQTSQDILWVTIAVCIALFTVFSCWGIFYLVMIIRRASKALRGVEQMIANINETIKTTKEKIEHSAAYLSVLADGARKVIDIVKEQAGTTSKKVKGKR